MFGLEVLRSLFIIIGAQARPPLAPEAKPKKLGACDYGHKERAGSAAVVIKDVAPRTVVGGVPAKFIKNV